MNEIERQTKTPFRWSFVRIFIRTSSTFDAASLSASLSYYVE